MKKSELNFKIGDVVQLKSGGPKMTINNFEENTNIPPNYTGDVGCIWFVNYMKNEGFFHQDTLKKMEENHTPRIQ